MKSSFIQGCFFAFKILLTNQDNNPTLHKQHTLSQKLKNHVIDSENNFLFMDQLTSEEETFALLQQAKQGHQQAFEKVYQQLFLPTYRYILRRVHDKSISEDLTQVVFLKVFTSRSEVTAQSSPLAYFFTVARNVVIDHWKKNARDLPFSLPLTEDIPTVSKGIEEKERHDQIIKGLQQLEEIPSTILKLKFFEGYSTEEIASQLHLSIANVRQIQCRALKKLRELVQI